MHARKHLIVATLAFSLGACGFRDLAPPAAPKRAAPKVEERSTPPAEGRTRVILDANGERATVTEVNAWSPGRAPPAAQPAGSALPGLERPVCIAPCEVDFEPGLHVLRFSSMTDDRSSIAHVQIDEREKTIRHAMGRSEDPSGARTAGYVLTGVGAGLVTAAALMLLPLVSEYRDEDEATLEAGLAVAGVGGVFIGVGVPLMVLGRPTRQEGSTSEFSRSP